MSLKEGSSAHFVPASGGEWSLAARLMLWSAISTFALVLLTSVFLYLSLTRSLDSEDDLLLLNKAIDIRELLRTRDMDTSALRWEVESEGIQHQENRVYVRILDAAGKILLASPGMDAELSPQLFPVAELPILGVSRGAKVTSSAGHPYRLFTARIEEHNADEPEIIQIALDTALEEELLKGYREQIWMVLATGLLLSCAGGWAVARKGIQPIREITNVTQNIHPTTLHERIRVTGFPTELRALAMTFNQMLDRLESAFSRISQFSADIAHELRTPINNLRGEAEVMLSRPRDASDYAENLTSSLEEYNRLSRLIEGLLFLARAEQPEATLRRESFVVSDELASIEAFYEPLASDAGVQLQVKGDKTVSAQLDRILFQQAIGNLVENAITHTPSGGVIRIEIKRSNNFLQIEVQDTGDGIPAEHLPYIFERFYRADSSRTHRQGGAGLGLALVKSIAMLHGGTVEATSTLSVGTRMRFSVPIDIE